MIDKEVDVVGNLDTSQMCEQFSMMIDTSLLQNQNGRSQGAEELHKKLRSIKLSKSPSLKPSRRRAKNRSNQHALSNGAHSFSSQMSTCSDTSTEHVQNSARSLTRGYSFNKPVKSLRRISSLKFKNHLMRKSSGGNQMNNLKKSRMARPATSSSDAGSSSSSFSKESCCSNEKTAQFQASSHTSESSYCSSNETKKRSIYSKANSKTCPGEKSPVTASSKLATPKSKKGSMRKQSEISQVPELGVQRPTCSSALKGSKLPEMRGVQAEGAESEGISGTKVCPFTYCSLHGHRHASVPPLKRLISIRRRMLKDQRRTTLANQSTRRVKRSGKTKEDRKNETVCNAHGDGHETTSPGVETLGTEMFVEIYAEPEGKPTEVGTFNENSEEKNYSYIHVEESLQQISDSVTVEQHDSVSLPALDDASPESFIIGTDSEATSRDPKEENIAASNHDAGTQSTCTDNLSNNDPTSIGEDIKVDGCATVKAPERLETPIPDEVAESTSEYENKEISFASNSHALEIRDAASVEQESKPNRATSVAHGEKAKGHKYIRMWQLMYKHAVKGATANVENQVPLDGPDKEEQVEGTNTVFEMNNVSSSETDERPDLVNHSAGDQNNEVFRRDAIKLVQEAFDDILLPEVQDFSYDDQSFTSGIGSDQEALGQSQEEAGEQNTSISSHSSVDSMVHNPEETSVQAENVSAPKEDKTGSKVGDEAEKKTPKSWSSLKKFILLKRFFKAVEKVRSLNYRKPQYLPLDPDSEAEKVRLRQQKTEERKNAEEWMLDYALQQVISKLPPAQQRRVALLVEAFETVLPFPEIKTSRRSNGIDSSDADVQVCNGLSVQSADHKGKESDSGASGEILLGNISSSEKNVNEHPAQARDVQMDDQQSPVNIPKLKESSTDHCCIEMKRDITSPEATNEDQKKKQTVTTNTHDHDKKVIVAHDETDFANISLSETKYPRLCDETSLKRDEPGSSGYEGLVNETVQVASKDADSITSLELSNMSSKVGNLKPQTNKLTAETVEPLKSSEDQFTDNYVDSTEDNMVVSFASVEPTDEPVEGREEVSGGATPESGFGKGFPPIEESHSDCSTDVRHESQLKNQKYTNLWFLVYKHMASSIDGAEEKQVDEASSLFEKDKDMSMKNDSAENKSIAFRHIEAIKLQVEKAIDEIVLPENQDESDDDKSSNRGLIPDQEPPETKVVIEGKPFISTYSNSTKFDNATIQEEEKAAAKVEDKPPKKMSKNWSNLKKMILLNRFIKALENVKKFSPRGPRYLPLEPDQEAEKVRLKQQNIDERKNSEEWMLDYALQQAVARLTPARKRKVSLLVEAFETVIPSNGIPNPFKPQVTH